MKKIAFALCFLLLVMLACVRAIPNKPAYVPPQNLNYPVLLMAVPAQSARQQPAPTSDYTYAHREPKVVFTPGVLYYDPSIPAEWAVCVDGAKVYSNPGDNPEWALYSLPNGSPVRVRELDQGTRTWARISGDKPSYILFTNLCPNWQDD